MDSLKLIVTCLIPCGYVAVVHVRGHDHPRSTSVTLCHRNRDKKRVVIYGLFETGIILKGSKTSIHQKKKSGTNKSDDVMDWSESSMNYV